MPPKTEPTPTPEVPFVSTLQEGGLPSLAIDPKELDLGAAAKSPRRKYWHGTMPSSPYQNSAAGGISFNRFADPNIKDAAGKLNRVANLGEVSELTEAQAQRVLQGIISRVVRWTGGVGKMEMRRTNERATLPNGKLGPDTVLVDAGYIAESGDVPFAEYVYFVRLPDVLPEGWRANTPLSVAETTRRAAKVEKKSA